MVSSKIKCVRYKITLSRIHLCINANKNDLFLLHFLNIVGRKETFYLNKIKKKVFLFVKEKFRCYKIRNSKKGNKFLNSWDFLQLKVIKHTEKLILKVWKRNFHFENDKKLKRTFWKKQVKTTKNLTNENTMVSIDFLCWLSSIHSYHCINTIMRNYFSHVFRRVKWIALFSTNVRAMNWIRIFRKFYFQCVRLYSVLVIKRDKCCKLNDLNILCVRLQRTHHFDFFYVMLLAQAKHPSKR